MTPAGQNYPIHEHTFLFWGLYLGVVITVTFALICVFIYAVHRAGQQVLPAAPEAADALPARPAAAALDQHAA